MSSPFILNNGNQLTTGGVQAIPVATTVSIPNSPIDPPRISNRIVPDSFGNLIEGTHYVGCQRDIATAVNQQDSLQEEFNSPLNQPEILMSMDFNPLFSETSRGNKLTSHGNFFELQLAFKNLKTQNIQKIIKDIEDSDPELKKTLEGKRKSFQDGVSDLHLKVLLLYNFLNEIENAKYSLDLRSHLSIVCAHDIIKTLLPQYMSDLPDDVTTGIYPKFGIPYALSNLGHSPLHVEDTYTNTKTWAALVVAAKMKLKGPIPTILGLPPDTMIRDAFNVNDISDALFDVNNINNRNFVIDETLPRRDPYIIDIQTLIYGGGSTNPVGRDAIYKNLPLDNSATKRVFLFNSWASKIWRFSRKMSNAGILDKINSTYGVNVTNGVDSSEFITNIFGVFPQKIDTTDAISILRNNAGTNGLITLAYESLDGKPPIMSLEPKAYESNPYIVGYGGIEYLESLLDVANGKFNTSNLERYFSKVSSLEINFTDLIKNIDLLGLEPILDSTSGNSIFEIFKKQFLWNTDSFYSNVGNSKIAPVFCLAASNTRLKSLLFAYVISQVEGVDLYPSASLTFMDANGNVTNASNRSISDILELIIEEIVKNLPTLPPPTQNEGAVSGFSKDEIIEAFTDRGDKFYFGILKPTLKKISVGLKSSLINESNQIKLTRYGKYQYDVAMAVVFDMVVSLIDIISTVRFDGARQEVITDVTTMNGAHTERIIRITTGQFSTKVENDIPEFRRRIQPALDLIESDIEKENNSLRYAVISILSTLRKLKNIFSTLLNSANSSNSISAIRDVEKYFEDVKQFKFFLRSENQVHLILNHLTELKSIDTSRTNVFGELGQRLKNEFFKMMSLPIFTGEKSKDFDILSIGIPHNIHNILKQGRRPDRKVQDDIINLKIYKIDHGYPFVVFKPKEYIFELSRFFVREDFAIKNRVRAPNTLMDSVERFATRDRSQVLSFSSELIQYLSHTDPAQIAFLGIDYSYLTPGQKNEIFKNHVLSNLLEIYIQYMTSLDVGEMSLDVDPEAYKNLISDLHEKMAVSHTKNFLKKQKKSFSSINDIRDVNREISLLSGEARRQLEFELNILSNMNQIKTNISDFDSYAKGICGTKYFDRVFNVLVNAHDFDIDESKTDGTTLEKLRASNMLISVGSNQHILRKNPIGIYSYFSSIEIL